MYFRSPQERGPKEKRDKSSATIMRIFFLHLFRRRWHLCWVCTPNYIFFRFSNWSATCSLHTFVLGNIFSNVLYLITHELFLLGQSSRLRGKFKFEGESSAWWCNLHCGQNEPAKCRQHYTRAYRQLLYSYFTLCKRRVYVDHPILEASLRSSSLIN